MRTEQTRLIRCLLYGFVDYSGKRTKLFDVLTSDQGLKVRTATYGPEIDQSQHAKSISHIIKPVITRLKKLWRSFQSKAVHKQEKKKIQVSVFLAVLLFYLAFFCACSIGRKGGIPSAAPLSTIAL